MSERAGSYILPPLQNIRPRMFKQKHTNKQNLKLALERHKLLLRYSDPSLLLPSLILLFSSAFYSTLTLLCYTYTLYSATHLFSKLHNLKPNLRSRKQPTLVS